MPPTEEVQAVFYLGEKWPELDAEDWLKLFGKLIRGILRTIAMHHHGLQKHHLYRAG